MIFISISLAYFKTFQFDLIVSFLNYEWKLGFLKFSSVLCLDLCFGFGYRRLPKSWVNFFLNFIFYHMHLLFAILLFYSDSIKLFLSREISDICSWSLRLFSTSILNLTILLICNTSFFIILKYYFFCSNLDWYDLDLRIFCQSISVCWIRLIGLFFDLSFWVSGLFVAF